MVAKRPPLLEADPAAGAAMCSADSVSCIIVFVVLSVS
jgi:hypothetical protein